MVKDALRIAELEKLLAERTAETIQMSEQLSVINSVQEALVKEMDLQAIYDLVGNRIQELFDAQVVGISTFELEDGTEKFQYIVEKGERFYPEPRPLGKLRLHLIETRKKIIINTRQEGEAWFGTEVIPGTEPIKSAVFVPLVIGDKITSYVTLQNIDKENAFSDSEIRLLETLANSMSTALENARLLKETEQRTAELAVINSVQEGLAKELDIQAIYDLVGNRIRELFDAQVVGIGTFDHVNSMETLHYLIEKGERYYPTPKPINSLRRHIITSREKLVINKSFSTVADTFGIKPVPGTQQPKSAVYVPMLLGDKITGYVSLQNIDKENAFSESDLRLLETLANSMGVALENARLFDETTRLLKETEQQKAELGVINSVQEGLAKELDMQAIYDLVGDRIRQLFNAQAVIIANFDHDTATEHFKYLIEDGQRFYLASRPYDKLRQHLIINRQKIVINTNYAEAYGKFGLKTLPGTNMTKSGVFVPLIIGDKVNSYISLQNNETENAFSESDVRLLETLANSMSVALENARLFDETTRLLKETEQRTAELAVINSVQEGLARELDMNAIYDLVGNKIRDVFDAQAVVIATFDHDNGTEKFNFLFEKGERYHAEPRRYDKLRYQLIMTKQKILINSDSEKAFSEFGLKVVAGTELPKSLLFVPLIVGNRVTSYVSLQNVDRENAFSDADVRLLETLANSMSVALENARLFDETTRLLKETEQRTAELSVINSVQGGLAKEIDMHGIYELVGEKIREIFDAQVIDIVTYDSKTNLLEDRYAYEKGDRTLVGTWTPSGFRKKVIDSGQLLLINEDLERKSERLGSNVIHGEIPKSVVFVPMISSGSVIGMISLQNLDHENAFSSSNVNLLTTLANSMSIALESARRFDETNRLLKETEQRNAELAVINSVQESLVAKMDMQGIYELVGEKIREIFDAQVIDIVTYEPNVNLIEDRYSFEKGDRTLLGPRVPKGFRKHVIQSRQLLVHNENVEQAMIDYDNEILIGEKPKSQIYVPMIAGGEVKGIISLQNLDHEHAFSDSDVSLITTLANSMSVALESARLFDETTRLLKETEQRTAELSVINSVQEGLAKELNIQGIYELVGEKMREIFSAQVIDIVTYDSSADIMEDRYSFEKGDRTLSGTWKPTGFRKHVIESGHLLVINENLEEKSVEFNSPVLHGEQPKSVVFVPLISGNEVKGMISLQNLDHEHAFSDSDVNLLTTLANSMTVALESARLFDETSRLLKETEQRNAELAVINSVQESLVAKMDINGIYELVGEKFREIFDAQVIDIVTYDPGANLIEDRYAYEKGDRTLLGPRPVKGFRRHVIKTKQILLHNQNVEQATKDFNNEILIGEMPKSQVYVPMIAGGEVKGIISLQNVDHEFAFSDSDVNLLTTLANSMSVALESARLFDETTRLLKETEQRTAELAVINSVQEGLARELDIHGIYKLVGDRMCNLFPDTQTLVIRTFNHEAGEEYFEYFIEKGVDMKVDPRPFMWANKQLIQSKHALLINENYLETAKKYGSTGVTKGDPPKSAVFVPMIVGDIVKGSVSLQNVDREHAFTDSDLRLLTTLTNSMSVALENARLFDETTRLLKETEQRTAELSVINSVQDGLARELDISGIYDLVGEKMREIFNAQVIDIVSYDKKTNMIEDCYTYEKGDRTLLGPRPLKGFRKHVIETAKSLVINKDVYQERSKYDQTVISGKGAKSIVLVPMIASGEVTGVISLQNLDMENAFSDADVNLLTTLSNSMSVALESARLFDETTRLLKETEQRTAELAVINSVQEGLAKELDIQGIYDLVGDRIIKVFNAPNLVIRTFDLDTGKENWRYAIEKGERQYIEPKPFVWHSKRLMQTQKPIQINENYLETSKKFGGTGVFVGQPTKSGIFVPMIVGGVVKGSVSLQNVDKENAYTEADLRLLTTITNSMSVALENARLFDETNRLLKETEQRTAELSVINSVQEGLAKVLSIQGIYELVGEKIKDIFNAQVIDITTYDRKTKLIEDRYAFEKGDRSLLGPRKPTGFRKHVIETCQPLVINQDMEKYMQKYGNVVMHGEPSKSVVFVPMIAGGEITGVISLQNIDQENAFSDAEVSLLKTLANSMTVALESARLFAETTRLLSETEQRTAELSVINSVQDGLAKELSIHGIYELVGEKIREIFNAQVIDITVYDRKTNMIEDRYGFEKGDRTLVGPRPLKGFRKHVIETGKALVINKDLDLQREKFDQTVVIGEGAKSIVLVPMISSGEVSGVISLQNLDQEEAFSPSDVNLLTTLANSMSVALENARLFDETNRLLKETEQRTAELAVINSVQEGLAKELDIQGIYDLVGERIRNLFDAQVVVIRTFDHAAKLEHLYYAFEKGERIYSDPRPIMWANKQLINSKEPLLISENYLEISKKYGGTGVSKGQSPKSAVFVPMMIGDVVKGSISLQNVDRENAFSDSDLRLLTTLTNSMSVALENARLFDETNRLLKETEQRTAELAVINSVQEGLAKELDMQGIYNLVGDRLCDLFPDTQTLVIRTFDHAKGIESFKYAIEKGVRLVVDDKPFMWANKQLIASKKPLDIRENYLETSISHGGTGVTKGQPPKSAVFVPMLVGDTVNGSISLQNVDRENAFTDSDLRLLTTITNSMSVALENARLFDETNRLLKETEQRTAELAVINSVQEGLAKELDMQGIYDLVGDRLCELFPDTQTLVIRTFDHTNGMENWHFAIEKGERQFVEPRPLNWNSKELIRTKKPLDIKENYVETSKKHGGSGVTAGQPPKSAVFVPMLVGDIVKGSVSLQNVDKENAFTDADLRLLTTITNSMSVALENARLFEETNRLLKETEQRTAELAVINSVQEGLVREIDMQAIYDTVGERLCNLFNIQTVVIRTFDHDTGKEIWQYAKEKGERQFVEPRPFNWNSKVLINTKKPLDIRENYLETSKQHGGSGVTAGQPPRSAVFVPMIVGEVVKGSVSLQNVDIENAFSDSDIRLLTTLTNSMSVALENARLFEETSRLLKETEQRTAELAVINSVQDGLVREMDINAIYELVGKRLCDLFNTQTVLIRTFDHEKGQEIWRYVIEKGERHYSEPRPLIWANKHLIQQQKPILINENYLETAKKYGSSGVSMGSPPKSAVFVPMIVGDIVKGSVSLQNVEMEHAFSESDLRLLTTITNSMSVALENARLFDETTLLLAESKQRAAELSTVNSISKALASQLDPDDLIKMVGDQLKDLFKANIVYLAILNKKTNIIHFPYQYGDSMEPIKLGEGLTSKIIMTGEPILVNKDLKELRKQMGIESIGVPAASYLGVPIPVGDENIGVLSVQSTEHENRFKENDLRLLSTIASSVGVALRNATLFEDVQQAKMEAEAASKLAEQANEAKSAFLSTVSHELRTPLTSVLGFAKIIKKRLEERIFPIVDRSDNKIDKAIAQVSENLHVVISEGTRLTHLINDVLDLAKIEAGKMEFAQENVSMSDVAERALAATTSLFEQKSLKLIRKIDTDLPDVIGDSDKLIQVMINLISNSVKFTDEGSITCSVKKVKNEIVASITDTGIGIAPEDFGAVFEQFKQVGGDTLTDKPKGTGLGLPICKEIVEHLGGRIWLESKVGKGSTFSFALPIEKQDSEERPIHLDDLVKQLKEQVANSQLNLIGKASTILIVDDDESIRSLLHQELGDAGYQITEAANGKEALDCVKKQRPDLIILDIMMPEMNGFDVAAVLKNDPNTMDIPIIVLSVVQDKARGFRIGVDRYLTKPIDTGLLFSEIGSLLEQGHAKKKVMIVDEDSGAVNALSEVLKEKGYEVTESKEKDLLSKAKKYLPDIIIINSVLSGKQDIVQTLRFEKGLENVLFLVYQ